MLQQTGISSTNSRAELLRRPALDLRYWLIAALGWLIVSLLLGTYLRSSFLMASALLVPFKHCLHAHSHVAFFGWAGALLMGLLYRQLSRLEGFEFSRREQRLIGIHFYLIQVMTAAALLSFWLQGYGLVSIAFSTANMLLWLFFLGLLAAAVRRMRDRPWPPALRYAIGAAAFLVLAAAATGLLTVLRILGMATPAITQSVVQAFLQLYTEGWLMLGIMALVLVRSGQGQRECGRLQLLLLVYIIAIVGSAVRLATPDLLPDWLIVLAHLTGLAIASLNVLFIREAELLRLGWAGRIAAAFFLAKAIMEIVPILPGADLLIQQRVIQIAYLHWKLLGLVSFVLLWQGMAAGRPDHIISEGALRPLKHFALAAALMVLCLLLTALPIFALWLGQPAPALSGSLYLVGQGGATLCGLALIIITFMYGRLVTTQGREIASGLAVWQQ